ncbi:hypothetical protein, partial [Klebsiella oxytoca]|uniref:hypothetical protein n=1 Tax=Klebsiella oxytoca TaxID=571 RepID=UPI003C12FF82
MAPVLFFVDPARVNRAKDLTWSEAMTGRSVGEVSPQSFHFDEPLRLRSGASFGPYDLMVETYGRLNAERS